jgi:hypothetical protein
MRSNRPLTRKSITPEQFRNFIFAGRSVFTLENSETGNYLTFKVKQIKKNYKEVPGQFAIECKTLGDKAHGYKFLGFVDLNERKFKKRYWDANFVGFKTWVWLLKNIERLEDFTKLAIYHEGRCCKCGMPLTVPESIDSGIGPECNKRMYSKSIQILKDLGTWQDSLTYEENVSLGLEKDMNIWVQVIIPEELRKGKKYLLHKTFEAWDIF